MEYQLFTARLKFILFVSVVALFSNACVPPQLMDYHKNRKLGLKEAVTLVGGDLKNQLAEALQKEAGAAKSRQLIVLDPVLSIESGQQFKADQQIASILERELDPAFKVAEISPENLGKAGYVLTGALSQSANLSKANQANCQLVMAIVELSTGMVKAKAQIDITGFPSEPLSFYKDSPLFLRDKNVRLATLIFSWSVGQAASPEYMQFLPEKANIQRGIISYDSGHFADAASSFSRAVEHLEGRTLSSYTGLYLSSKKLHRYRTAYKAFSDLLTIAMQENHRLDLNLQFRANSPAFIPNPRIAKDYAWMLRNIARYMHRKRYCLDISGHSSRSADKRHDEQLSLARAKTIQGVMSVTYPGILAKSHVEGKGFQENIVGNGANNDSDAVDRRIELSVVDCRELQK